MKSQLELLDDLQKLHQQISKAKAELNKIKDESGTRKRYLAEQEAIISHMMEEANNAIADAHTQYSQLERSINFMESQKIILKSEIETLVLDKNTLEADIILMVETSNI